MAFYELSGPTASQVRQDVFEYIYKNLNDRKINYKSKFDEIMLEVVLKEIPDSRNDFGSHRGYIVFNVKKDIAKNVIKILNYEYALYVLKKKLTPYVTHNLYKPGGIRMRKVCKKTLVGKKN